MFKPSSIFRYKVPFGENVPLGWGQEQASDKARCPL